MRIWRRTASAGRKADFDSEIRRIMTAPGPEGRVCDDCAIKCDTCGSISCQCMCHSQCPEAPARLSSDPEHFPIEAGIAPLVFEMKRDGECTPCWSCEGHTQLDGSLWKIPRVWFYCPSMVHLRLIGRSVHALSTAGKIHAPWQVVVTHSDPGNIDTTFSLEPALLPATSVSLNDLQADVLVIAAAWPDFLKHGAQSLSRTVIDGPEH